MLHGLWQHRDGVVEKRRFKGQGGKTLCYSPHENKLMRPELISRLTHRRVKTLRVEPCHPLESGEYFSSFLHPFLKLICRSKAFQDWDASVSTTGRSELPFNLSNDLEKFLCSAQLQVNQAPQPRFARQIIRFTPKEERLVTTARGKVTCALVGAP